MINGRLTERIVWLSSLSKNLDNRVTNSEVQTTRVFTGLKVGFRTDVKLDGTQAGVATMTGTQAVGETLRVTRPSIDSAVSALLLRMRAGCCVSASSPRPARRNRGDPP
jgi:hypothetical protein